ncbi:hypothetical protein OTK51_13330 [Vibrio scophthalmi]|uniref:hypothetical protein n=1 Tax=Vibrio scophthalmi TaxID=45658 RepID=UPI0022851B0F|nr:hypothetical protein [Vibrio scophthalmi]MCY9804410.1 hypothetical protein [Vibrio scophthalmi]
MSDKKKIVKAMLNQLQDHEYVKQLALLSCQDSKLAVSIIDVPTDFHKLYHCLCDEKVFDKYTVNEHFSELLYYKLFKPGLYQLHQEEYLQALSVSFQDVHYLPSQVMTEIDRISQHFQPLEASDFVEMLHYQNPTLLNQINDDLESDFDSVRVIQKYLNKDLSQPFRLTNK